MSKSLPKFCSVAKYLEYKEPKLYETLEDLCMTGFTRPKKIYNGVTVIVPSAADIKKLADMRYSQIDEVQEILGAHIINDYLPSPSIWWQKKEDIPNANRKKVEVEKVTSDKVVLPGGVELEIDKHYKQLGNRNIAVYRVTKGTLRPDPKAKPATFALAKTSAPPTRGGAPLVLVGEFDKQAYMYKRIGQFLGNITSVKVKYNTSEVLTQVENPLIEDILSFNNWLRSNPDAAMQSAFNAIVYTPLSTFIALFTLPMFNDALSKWYDNGRFLVLADSSHVKAYLELASQNTYVPDSSLKDNTSPGWMQTPARALYGSAPEADLHFKLDFARFIETKMFLPTEYECCMTKFDQKTFTAEQQAHIRSFVHDLSEVVTEILHVFGDKSSMLKTGKNFQMVVLENFRRSTFACFNPQSGKDDLAAILARYSIDLPDDPAKYVLNLLQSLKPDVAQQVVDRFSKSGITSSQVSDNTTG